MTLPASPPISLKQVGTELGVSSAGLSLSASNVRTLAGVPTGPISLHDLLGKSAYTPMVVTLTGDLNLNYPYPFGGGGSTSDVPLLPFVSITGGSGGFTYQARISFVDTGTNWAAGYPFINGTMGLANSLDFLVNPNPVGFCGVIVAVTDNTAHTVDSNQAFYQLNYLP